MIKRVLLSASLLVATPALAQQGGGVVVFPPITAGHCASWRSLNILQDAGAACGSGSGTVTSVTGTANQISVANGTTTPVVSVPTTFIAPGTLAATSGAFGGATIGTDALGVTGTATISGAVSVASLNAATGRLRAQGSTAFATGAGIEILYSAGLGQIFSFDHAASYLDTGIYGSTAGTGLRIGINGIDMSFFTPNRHWEDTQSTPTVTSGAVDCGTTPAIAGTDNEGRVTVGSSTNGGKCTVSFARAWTNPPICMVADETTGVLVRPANVTTGKVEITGVIVAGDKLTFLCRGYQ
ncbi:MAG TPA: hypothetical protein VGN16_09460 [Acidobacteriaceae bacterium]